MDPPAERTSHTAPTPTSGGLAILAASCLGLAVFTALAPAEVRAVAGGRATAAALAAAAALSLLGAVDDLLDLPALPKLAVMAAVSVLWIGFAPAGLGLGVGWALAALLGVAWLLVAVNAVNFMDGSDGLVAGVLAAAFGALAFAAASAGRPWEAGAALAACAAHAGFLPWNLSGRLFQGDAGALFSGLLFAALGLAAADALGPLFGPLALLPLLVDVALTLLRRAHARRPLLNAHREHLYQRWLQATSHSHAALAWRMWGLTAASSALALVTVGRGLGVQAAALALAGAALGAGWLALSRRVDARLAAVLRLGASPLFR